MDLSDENIIFFSCFIKTTYDFSLDSQISLLPLGFSLLYHHWLWPVQHQNSILFNAMAKAYYQGNNFLFMSSPVSRVSPWMAGSTNDKNGTQEIFSFLGIHGSSFSKKSCFLTGLRLWEALLSTDQLSLGSYLWELALRCYRFLRNYCLASIINPFLFFIFSGIHPSLSLFPPSGRSSVNCLAALVSYRQSLGL